MIHFGSFPNSKNISMFPLYCTWTKIEKNKIIELGEEGLKLETYESICWEKNAWFPIIMFPWRNPSNYRTPFPKQLTILATQIPKSWTRRVEWNPDISLWNLAPPFSVSLRVKIYRLAGTQIFFFHFCWYGWNHPAGSLTSWKVAPEATHFSIKFRHSINMNFWFCSLRGLQKKITYHIVSQANDSRRKNIIQIFWTGWGFPWTVINTSATNTPCARKLPGSGYPHATWPKVLRKSPFWVAEFDGDLASINRDFSPTNIDD